MSNRNVGFQQLTILAAAIACVLAFQSVTCAQCACGGASHAPMVGEYYAVPGGALPPELAGLPPGAQPGQLIEIDSIYLTVNVPETAILKINGDPTISVGSTRYFVVRGLELEREYKFVIVAETANAAGVAMEETKTVTIKTGSSEMVSLKPVKRKIIVPIVVTAEASPAAEAGEPKAEAAGDAAAGGAKVSSRRQAVGL